MDKEKIKELGVSCDFSDVEEVGGVRCRVTKNDKEIGKITGWMDFEKDKSSLKVEGEELIRFLIENRLFAKDIITVNIRKEENE